MAFIPFTVFNAATLKNDPEFMQTTNKHTTTASA